MHSIRDTAYPELKSAPSAKELAEVYTPNFVELVWAEKLPFLLTVLGLGLVISTRARSQAEAFQLSMGTVLPSVFLSGYIFLINNMPPFFQGISRFIPVTYYIRILRGIILRGAGFSELWLDAAILTIMGITTTLIAARLFVQQKG